MGDETLATLLPGLQLDELSASPRLIPELKQRIRRFNSAETIGPAREVLQLANANEVRPYLQTTLKKAEPEL
jgi:phosphotransferase system enzyme I (PtsI)